MFEQVAHALFTVVVHARVRYSSVPHVVQLEQAPPVMEPAEVHSVIEPKYVFPYLTQQDGQLLQLSSHVVYAAESHAQLPSHPQAPLQPQSPSQEQLNAQTASQPQLPSHPQAELQPQSPSHAQLVAGWLTQVSHALPWLAECPRRLP
jgi:hypothetical protein